MYSIVRSLDRETTTRRDAKGFTRDANDRSDATTTSANERRERRRVTTIERHGGPRDDSHRRRFVCTARPPRAVGGFYIDVSPVPIRCIRPRMTQRHAPKRCRHPVYLHHPRVSIPRTHVSIPPVHRPRRCAPASPLDVDTCFIIYHPQRHIRIHTLYTFTPIEPITYIHTTHTPSIAFPNTSLRLTHTRRVTTHHHHHPLTSRAPSTPRRRRSRGARGHTTSDDSSRPRSPRSSGVPAGTGTARSTGHDPSIDRPPAISSPLCDSR